MVIINFKPVPDKYNAPNLKSSYIVPDLESSYIAPDLKSSYIVPDGTLSIDWNFVNFRRS